MKFYVLRTNGKLRLETELKGNTSPVDTVYLLNCGLAVGQHEYELRPDNTVKLLPNKPVNDLTKQIIMGVLVFPITEDQLIPLVADKLNSVRGDSSLYLYIHSALQELIAENKIVHATFYPANNALGPTILYAPVGILQTFQGELVNV